MRQIIRCLLQASLQLGTAFLVFGCAAQPATLGPKPTFDILIKNGNVIDGTGSAAKRADIGIRGKFIAEIGDLSGAQARQVIHADGLAVSPGFIDMHSHASFNYLIDGRALSKVSQGITLEIEGEGESVAPINDAMEKLRAPYMAPLLAKDPDATWRSLSDFFELLESDPGTLNFATYLGTSNVRELAVGYENRPANEAELAHMRATVAEAMEDGALGVYSALSYSPDGYNSTAELIEMAKVAQKYGGLYQTHPRSESNALTQSMAEIEAIARGADIPVHITHIKAAFTNNWGRMREIVDGVERMQADGLTVTADIYPYERASGELTALLPPWAQDGGRAAVLRRLADLDMRAKIKADLGAPATDWENEYRGTKGGPAGITVVQFYGPETFQSYVGKTLAEIGAMRGADPRDAMFDLITNGRAHFISHITSQDDIALGIVQPWVSFGTDGSAIAPDGPLSNGLPHPRAYGAFTKVLSDHVRSAKRLTLEEAVRKATSFPAEILKIERRGRLEPGYYADIAIFDPDTVDDQATYEQPHQLSTGVIHVLVNGTPVYVDGVVTDARPGMVLRGPGYKP